MKMLLCHTPSIKDSISLIRKYLRNDVRHVFWQHILGLNQDIFHAYVNSVTPQKLNTNIVQPINIADMPYPDLLKLSPFPVTVLFFHGILSPFGLLSVEDTKKDIDNALSFLTRTLLLATEDFEIPMIYFTPQNVVRLKQAIEARIKFPSGSSVSTYPSLKLFDKAASGELSKYQPINKKVDIDVDFLAKISYTKEQS